MNLERKKKFGAIFIERYVCIVVQYLIRTNVKRVWLNILVGLGFDLPNITCCRDVLHAGWVGEKRVWLNIFGGLGFDLPRVMCCRYVLQRLVGEKKV